MTYVITEPCIGTKDQSCVEVCPVDCIYDGGDQFFINPEDEVPEEMQSYIAKNVDYFE
jgi:NAD-dependent dihydropyrimidine dehydrogenase PreA subunit